jgi:quercetin dioxygenase-like cupin family protein
MIYVVSGICHARKEGGEVQQLSPGDMAWFAAGEKHWHGAAPGKPMVHLAVQEADEHGQVVVWMEHVSD